MKIKILLHNMISYKNKIIPIIISVGICVVMVLACFMYVDMSKRENREKYDGVYQKMDLVMYFPNGAADNEKNFINGSGYSRACWFANTKSAVRSGKSINGCMLQIVDYTTYSKLKTVSEFKNGGDGVVIKDYVANKNSLSVGDSVQIYINGQFHKFKVLGITVSGDMKTSFYGDVIVTEKVLAKHNIDTVGIPKNAAGLYFNRDSGKVDSIIHNKTVKDAKYTDYTAMYADDVKEDGYFLLAMYSILAIGIICVFSIVNSSFRQMSLARTPDIIMLKSLGISRRQESGYWYVQSAVLSAVSFAAGIIAGTAAVNIAFIFIFHIKSIVLPSAVCLITALLVTFVPNLFITGRIVRQMSKTSISTLLKQTSGNMQIDEIKPLYVAVKVIIMAACIVADKLLLRYCVTNKWLYVGMSIADMVLFSIIMCYLSTYVIETAVSGKRLVIIRSLHIGNRRIKNMATSVVLAVMLFVGMLGVFGNVSDTFIDSLKATLSYNYEVYGTFQGSDVKKVKDVFEKNGVDDYMFQDSEDAMLGNTMITSVGVNPDKITSVYSFTYSDGKKKIDGNAVAEKMKSDSGNILISDRLSKKCGIRPGDRITLEILGVKKKYTVAGTCNDAGNAAFISGAGQYNQIIVKDGGLTLAEMKKVINSGYKSDYDILSVNGIYDSEASHINENLSTFSTLSLIIVVIAALILINTLLMSVTEHKRDIAVLNTLGIKRRQLFRTLFLRVAVYTAASAAAGFAAALEFTYMSSGMMSRILYFDINQNLRIAESLKYAALIAAAMLAGTVFAVIYALRGNRESLISYVKE